MLESAIDTRESTPEGADRANNKMARGFFDNLRHWDRPKVFRYVILLVISLSGDGW